jgi:hypothetical protein
VEAYKDAFDYFDWNRSGTIPTKVKLPVCFFNGITLCVNIVPSLLILEAKLVGDGSL